MTDRWKGIQRRKIEACKAFDAETLTGTIVGITVLKCIFAGTVGSSIAGIGLVVGSFLTTDWASKLEFEGGWNASKYKM